MTAPRTISVPLTVSQWNALHTCAVGELESLTAADEASGIYRDLKAGVRAMERARTYSVEEARRRRPRGRRGDDDA